MNHEINASSSIVSSLSTRKGKQLLIKSLDFIEAHVTTTDLLTESENGIRLNDNFKHQNHGSKSRQENNSYYITANSSRPQAIPSSCHSKYDTVFEAASRLCEKKNKINRSEIKKGSGNRNLIRQNSLTKKPKQCKQRKHAELDKFIAEKVLDNNKPSSRNSKVKGFDHFGSSLGKIDKNNSKRSRTSKSNLFSQTAIDTRLSTQVVNYQMLPNELTMKSNQTSNSSCKLYD